MDLESPVVLVRYQMKQGVSISLSLSLSIVAVVGQPGEGGTMS